MSRTYRRVAVAWAVAGALLLSWSGLAAGVNAGSDSRYDDEVRQARTQQHFWRVVAGRDDGTQGGVLNKLARDLRDTRVNDLDTFRGDSNRYGGISDELGFDPFDGINCSECGRLESGFQDDVEEVKTGGLSQKLDELEPDKPDTMSGAPSFLWIAWLVSLPGTLGLLFTRHKRSEERKYSEFGLEMELVRSLDRAMAELPPSQGTDLQLLRDRLMEGIEQRRKYGEEEARSLKLEALKQEAQATLDAITVGNRALNE